MVEYFLFFFIYSFIISIGGKREKKFTLLGAFIILFILSAFRFNVGIDYHSYVSIYQTEGDFDELKRRALFTNEIGFNYLIQFLNFIGADYQFMFMLYSFIAIFFIIKFIDKFAPDHKLALFAYAFLPIYYLASFNVIRQSAAVSLFAFSTVYIYERKFWKYFFVIFMGALFFHLSIIIMLPVYFYAKLKLTRISEIIIICSSVCIGLVFSYFLKSTPYGLYFDRHMDFELNFIVFFFIVFFIFIIWHKDRIIQNEKLNIIYNIGLLSIVVFILMFENPNVGANLFLRLNNYFMVVNIVLIGLIPSLFKEHSIKNMVNILVIIGICSLFLRTIIDKGIIYQLVPYEMSVNYFLK